MSNPMLLFQDKGLFPRPGIGLDSRLGDDSPEEVAVHGQEGLVACGSGGSP